MPIRAWIPLLVIGAIVALALGGLFGGGASEARATSGGGVRLETRMPERLRSGILFESRFLIAAERPVRDATIGIIRATAMFAAVFILLRLMGKRELGQLTPFELVTLVVIGDLVQQGVTHNDFSVTGAVIAITTFAFWTVVLSLVSYLSPGARDVLEGKPGVLVFKGRVDRKMLARNRMTVSELESEMRLAGIRRLEQVEWALLEPNGKVSFIERERQKRSQQQDESDAA